jgi:RNA polymerase sigma-70 factor (ECF subfamily)
MDDEDRLIRAMAGGERDAWSIMYDRHVAEVFGFVYHLVGGNRGLAEELNQDVWLTVVQNFDRFDPCKGRFRDWLFGIARHRVSRHYRSRSPCLLMDDGTDPDGETDAGAIPSLELLEEVERVQILRAALIRLDAAHRDVLVGKYLEGRSVPEIADRTGRSAKAVESLLTRARARLRELLRPYFRPLTPGERHDWTDPSQGRS